MHLIEDDGDIYRHGSRIGKAENIPKEWVAAVYFFFFEERLQDN